ncbi:MAG: hypothetical protein BM565_05620 [Gammaproteobacteria bacterium MedPE]|nr:MAG: hypothetical protein BM565_05620 [Gammaproteobacteria bacterium MedPE]
MLILNNSHYFSQGTTRKCYFHPDNNELCVKIPLTDQGDRTRGLMKNIDRENRYYRNLAKKNISWTHLSRYHGDTETNLGYSSVYQLVRDCHGEIAKNLEDYLADKNFVATHLNELIAALKELYTYMRDNQILTTSLQPRNIVLNPIANQFKLIIIDDIGNSEFIRISEFIAIFARKKIDRKWRRMLTLIQSSNPFLFQNLHTDILDH